MVALSLLLLLLVAGCWLLVGGPPLCPLWPLLELWFAGRRRRAAAQLLAPLWGVCWGAFAPQEAEEGEVAGHEEGWAA